MVNFMLCIFYHNKKELHESRNLGKRILSQSFPFGYVTNIGDHCNDCLDVVKEGKARDLQSYTKLLINLGYQWTILSVQR